MEITIYNVQSRTGNKYIGLDLKKDSPEHQLIKTCKEKWWSGVCKLWLIANRPDSWAEVKERFAGYRFVKSEVAVSLEEEPWLFSPASLLSYTLDTERCRYQDCARIPGSCFVKNDGDIHAHHG